MIDYSIERRRPDATPTVAELPRIKRRTPLTLASDWSLGGEVGVLVGDGADDEHCCARGGRLTVLLVVIRKQSEP